MKGGENSCNQNNCYDKTYLGATSQNTLLALMWKVDRKLVILKTAIEITVLANLRSSLFYDWEADCVSKHGFENTRVSLDREQSGVCTC